MSHIRDCMCLSVYTTPCTFKLLNQARNSFPPFFSHDQHDSFDSNCLKFLSLLVFLFSVCYFRNFFSLIISHSELTKMARTRISVASKLKMAQQAVARVAKGESWRSIARDFKVQATQLKGWTQNIPVLSASSKKLYTLHSGRRGLLQEHEERIVQWIFDKRDRGVPVSYGLIVRKFERSIPELQEKSRRGKYMIVRRLCAANHLSVRVGTKNSQENPQVTLDKSLEFIQHVRPIVSGPRLQGSMVLNMDQTPVWFSHGPKRTLNLQGERSIPLVSSDTSSARVTVAVTVSSAGDMIKPMIIFKGKQSGRIALKELPTFENKDKAHHICQPRAWMDEENMCQWVTQVLQPYAQRRAAGSPVFLFLDAFKVHKMDSVKELLPSIRIQVIYIPPGCTGSCQPVDVGINKPFKDRMRAEWEKWLEGQDMDADRITTPSRGTVSSWVTDALYSIPEQVI